jgi:hypothetical protein
MQMNQPLLRRPAIFSPFPWLIGGESTRHGGVSQPPYASLNLGKNTDDDPSLVAENKRLFCAALGTTPDRMAWTKQIHGDQILSVDTPGGAEGFDALITGTPDILLVVSVADCTPILIADPANRAIAAIHAGWRGTAAGIVAKTLEKMKDQFGTRGSDCVAFVGTCIDECSFEVGDEVADQFVDAFKRRDPASGKYLVDLKKANAQQLHDFGIPEHQIEISPWSTILNNADYFSHRLEHGVTGRMLGFIGMR